MKILQAFKKRYIGFRISVGGTTPQEDVAKKAIYQHFLSFFGELGIGAVGLKLVKYGNGEGILRCQRSKLHEAIFCMACFAEYEGESARIEPTGVFGTLKGVERKMQKQKVANETKNFHDVEQKK
ncbi:MAG: Rpp14/Pop5 family protein [Candidatus Anstonellaceae archaeon]